MGTQLKDDTRQVVQAAIKGISQIATLPEITLRIIDLVEDPSSTAQDLNAVIANDPALCSRILKVVNSAFYGLPRQIGSINRAIVLLGLNAVKNIAIAASLAKLFRGGDICEHFSARDLWTHSVAAAAASKLISDELKLNLPDEAFLAGLIHDVGIMVEMQAQRERLVEVIDRLDYNEDGIPRRDMRELELEFLGADHEAFGAGLCEAWKFPQSFVYVTGNHHDPLRLPDGSRTLSCIVYVADRLTAEQRLGFRGDLVSLEINGGVLDEIRLDAARLERVRALLPAACEDAQATFQ